MHYIKGKGYIDTTGKPVGSKRKMELVLAKTYGYEGDRESFTRLVIESKVNRQLLTEQFHLGAKLKQQQPA